MFLKEESLIRDLVNSHDQELLDFRDSLYFIYNFHYIKEACWNNSEVLQNESFVDFRLQQVCESVLDYSLRIRRKEDMNFSKYFRKHSDIIWSSFEEFQVGWKSAIVSLKNRNCDALLFKSISRQKQCDNNSLELNILENEKLDRRMVEFISGFFSFLRRENLSVPRYDAWLSTYRRITVQVSNWQLPPSVPCSESLINNCNQSIGIFVAQMVWAAENGRIADLTRSLGKLGVEKWIPFEDRTQ